MYPCVVDQESSDSDMSIEALFGDLCCGTSFAYDEEVKEKIRATRSENSFMQSISQRISDPEISQTTDNAGMRGAPQQSGHDQRSEMLHEEFSSSQVERASHANGEIILGTPKGLPMEAHKLSSRSPFSLGVQSQVTRIDMIKENFRRRHPPSEAVTETQSRASPQVGSIPNQIQRRSNVPSISAQAASTVSVKIDGSAPARKPQKGVTKWGPHSDSVVQYVFLNYYLLLTC